MMKKILVSLGFIACVVSAIAQEKVYMPFFEVINMNKNYQYASSKLLKTYVDQGNKYEIVFPERDTNLVYESKDQAMMKAKSMGINHIIIGTLNRTGETVVISIVMYKVADGSKEWSALEKANGPDDLDPIMQKLATSMNISSDNSQKDDIYNVTSYESKELNKMKATTFYGLEIAGGSSSIHAKNNCPAGFSILYSGDLRTVIFDAKLGMYFSDVDMLNLSLHANFPLTNKRNTPFLSSGLGYGSTSLDYHEIHEQSSGLTVFAGGGYILNRTSDINLRLNANGFFSMYKIDDSFPVGILIGMSIFF